METIIDFRNKDRCRLKLSIWNDVIQEVAERKARGLQANIFSEKEQKVLPPKKEKKILRKYGLGAKYGKTYFTQREAECMVGLIKEKAIDDIAAKLVMSPRMVMEHIERMRTKVGCHATAELVDLVRASEFLENIDF